MCVPQLHNVMRDYEYVRLQCHVVVIFFFMCLDVVINL